MNITTPPIAKLPLGIRKLVRDQFQSEIPKWSEQLTRLTSSPQPFEIEVDVIRLFSCWKESEKKNVYKIDYGLHLAGYIRAFIEAVSQYTDDGRDSEALECFARAGGKYRVTIDVDNDSKAQYCDYDIADGIVTILFNPNEFAFNTSYLKGTNILGKSIDSVLLRRDAHFVPLVMLRNARKDIKLDKHKADLQNIFGEPVEISYDLRGIFDTLSNPRNPEVAKNEKLTRHKDLNYVIPHYIFGYFHYAVLELKSIGFGDDSLYRSEFLKVAPKGILFEVVRQLLLPDAKHNECIYQDGYFRLRTTPQYFGVNEISIAARAIDQL